MIVSTVCSSLGKLVQFFGLGVPPRRCMAWSAAFVDILSVTNLHDGYDKKFIYHFIYDSVHTVSDTVTLLP